MLRSLLALSVVFALPFSVPAQAPKELRVGIIGCDTSHAGVYTSIFNGPKAAGDPDFSGFKVVAVFPGGSPDLPISANRVEKFTASLRDKHGLEVVDSIEKLLPKVDVVLLLSVDGRVHWKQAEPVLKAGKRVFIDKPFTASLSDALRIAQLSQQTKTPLFSSSSLRFGKALTELKNDPKVGPVIGCMTYGPCSYTDHHPDLAFYGIHGLELLYSLMGKGCESVTRTTTKDCDTLTGVWTDGRVATYRGLRSGKNEFGATVFCKNAIVTSLPSEGYEPVAREMARFFRTGTAPVSMEEMVEIIAVLEAADLSKARNGAPVTIAEVMNNAKAKLAP